MSPLAVFLSLTLLSTAIQAGVISGHYGGHLDANAESSSYESLGSLGDHLQESYFPSDYAEAYKGAEYQASAAASEHIEYGGYEHQHFPQYEHESLGHEYHHSDLHDFDSKPVPGINHGKGALSYSTTYEFKDPKP